MGDPSPEPGGVPRVPLRRTPRQARSKARLARVLQAAEHVLIEEGVQALTTTRIAAQAKVSVGSLYQYLPDRDAVIDALAAGYFTRLEATMDDLVRGAADEQWGDPVGVLVDTYAALYRTEHGFRALWFGGSLTEQTRAADREHKVRMADGVRHILLGLGLARDDEALARACHAAVLAADALAQEAFRRDAEGDAALLEEAKLMLRGYLSGVVARYG